MMQLNLQVHDHIVHFYHLHALDWVNPVNALRADPRATSELQQTVGPNHPMSSPGYFRDVQTRLRDFVESGQLGLFKNGYWDNPAYLLPPEADLMAVTHYLEALDLQKEIVKIHSIFGGKNPHPNWLVGGVPCPINVHGTGAVGAISMERLNHVARIVQQSAEFVNNVYIPDVIAIGGFYRNWLHGGGLSSQAVMSYGDIPERANDYSPANLLLPAGAIINGDLSTVHEVDVRDPEQIQEFVDHSWYEYGEPGDGPASLGRRHPAEFRAGPQHRRQPHQYPRDRRGREVFVDQGPALARQRDGGGSAGPLHRGLRAGHERITDQVTGLLRTMDLPVEALFSTLGRTAARALEAQYCADLAAALLRQADDQHHRNGDESTANVERWDPATWPASTRGVGFTEAPRGALGHWVTISEGRIENYQCVVPTTWNGSPRDSAGNIGAFEASLLNTPMERPEEPVEILRTLHSFDPCLACSTHVMSPDGDELTTVKVR
jgi:hydrogenase large subunit